MNRFLNFVLLAICFSGCSSEETKDASYIMQEIAGRDTQNSPNRTPLYRIKTPESWQRKDASSNESLIDTKKSIVEFLIHDVDGTVRITIHNFPSETMESRIAPAAQINRWKTQFTKLNQTSVSIIPQSYSGFSGLLFEGSGEMNDENTTVIGWSMQLAPEHYRTLMHPAYASQTRSDITIKAVGKKDIIEKHRAEIYAFARSFELINEIPARL